MLIENAYTQTPFHELKGMPGTTVSLTVTSKKTALQLTCERPHARHIAILPSAWCFLQTPEHCLSIDDWISATCHFFFLGNAQEE